MTARDVRAALVLAVVLFLVYNANGREIGNFDSQPTKYAARELLLRGTLGLNHVVGSFPELGTRSGFVSARDGRYRSAYSPVPAIAAAAIVWPLWKTGAVDIRAPQAPGLIAVIAASFLAALSGALVYLLARRRLARGSALLVAIAFALGTGMWPTVSQTLWQHETTIFGLTMAVYAFCRTEIRLRDAVVIGLGLALAGTSRMQVSPAILILLVGTAVRAPRGAAGLAAAITTTAACVMMIINIRWFGSPLGAAPLLEGLHGAVHGQTHSFALSTTGLGGLLFSPSRGLLIYSPVVLVAAAGIPASLRGWRENPLGWCLAAASAQYLFYGSYSVWWGGHTFGPRYMLDILPLLAPLGVAGFARLHSPQRRAMAGVALAFSLVVSASGAFSYPHDRWNTDPVSVDRDHTRLWDWADSQIVRCWRQGPSPQNFNLLTPRSVRVNP
jgi:hypothetical protein